MARDGTKLKFPALTITHADTYELCTNLVELKYRLRTLAQWRWYKSYYSYYYVLCPSLNQLFTCSCMASPLKRVQF